MATNQDRKDRESLSGWIKKFSAHRFGNLSTILFLAQNTEGR